MITESYGTQTAGFTVLLPLTILWPRVSCGCGLLSGCRVTCTVLWGLPFHAFDVSWLKQEVSMSWISLQTCVRSSYTCPCTWSRRSLMSWHLPWHACTHICTLCIHQCYFCIVRNAVRDSLGCFPCVPSCGQVIPCPVCVFGGISLCLFFTHWRCTERFYMSSTYPNWQQAACCGILMLSSCMHESLTMFSSHSLLWSCSRAHGGNTVIWMNRLWNGLVHDEAV